MELPVSQILIFADTYEVAMQLQRRLNAAALFVPFSAPVLLFTKLLLHHSVYVSPHVV
jgi:hypothetical protein